jgi:hypothetical protein
MQAVRPQVRHYYGWLSLAKSYRSKLLPICPLGLTICYMETSKEQVIIADTSGLVSLFLPGDHNHKVAVKAAQLLQDEHRHSHSFGCIR